MQSSDPQHFFESDAALQKRENRTAKASNKYGNPIALKSKILAAKVDPRSPSSAIFVAESAGAVRRIDLDNGNANNAVFRGPNAPVTCVAIGGQESKTVFAGSWDKDVWSWDRDSKSPSRRFSGHADFVKAVICATLAGKPILISGGADKKIMVWDIDSGARLHTLSDTIVNMLAVQDLAIDPGLTCPDDVVLFSASSDPHVREWRIRLDSWQQKEIGMPDASGEARHTIREHETSVYKLAFDEADEDLDLWTASGDGLVKCLSRRTGFCTEDSFQHGDHVRAFAVTQQWVSTAGRDEDIKIWDRSSGELYCSLEGHYDEVTDLVVLQGAAERLVSVSIDGTIRTWNLDTTSLDELVKEQHNAKIVKEPEEALNPASTLTAEEEAELAELMGDDE